MDFSIEGYNGRIKANLVPSDENGVLVAQRAGKLIAGGSLSLSFRRLAPGLNEGDAETLQQFLKPDPELAGRYTLEDCSGLLHLGDGACQRLPEGSSVTEYAPAETAIERNHNARVGDTFLAAN